MTERDRWRSTRARSPIDQRTTLRHYVLSNFIRLTQMAQSSGSSEPGARAERLASLRSLSSSQYTAMATAEATMASLVFSPLMLILYTIDGAIYARNPVVLPGQIAPPRPQTFGGLLAAGLRSGASMTFRTVAWTAGTSAISATAKEQLKLGPRYVDGNDALSAPMVTGVHGLAGALTGLAVTVDFPMVPARRMLYTALAGVGGIALPGILASAGPFVRAQLASLGGGR